jgi:hypothetical protein
MIAMARSNGEDIGCVSVSGPFPFPCPLMKNGSVEGLKETEPVYHPEMAEYHT